MKPISREEQRQIELEMLLYVDSVCRKNQIEYTLAGGSLLGAVRHRGMIPWDDDIDILLLRPAYEKLTALLRHDDRYRLVVPEENAYFYPFAKLMDRNTVLKMLNHHETRIPDFGVYIDIFPVDGCPDSHDEQYRFQKKLRRELQDVRMSIFRSYCDSGTFVRRMAKAVLFFPKHLALRLKKKPEEWKKFLLDDMQTYPVQTSHYAGFLLSVYEEILPTAVYEEYMDIDFEGHSLRSIKAYDTYLKKLYGDYMTPPPEDKRISAHQYTAFRKENKSVK